MIDVKATYHKAFAGHKTCTGIECAPVSLVFVFAFSNDFHINLTELKAHIRVPNFLEQNKRVRCVVKRKCAGVMSY